MGVCVFFFFAEVGHLNVQIIPDPPHSPVMDTYTCHFLKFCVLCASPLSFAYIVNFACPHRARYVEPPLKLREEKSRDLLVKQTS